MKVGISMRMFLAKPGHGVKNAVGEPRHAISDDWIVLLQRLGFTPVLLPSSLEKIPDVDAIILSNGNNVDPSGYGGKPLEDVFKARDAFESRLTKLALKKDIPLLGVCRGSQFLNVFYGGSLEQNVSGHVGVTHEIRFTDGRVQKVNSFHDHGIARGGLGRGLIPIASSEDGLVEAFRHERARVLGVMWHPERGPNVFSDSLVKRFLAQGEFP